MKRLLFLTGAVLALGFGAVEHARAQTVSAIVVSACGTPGSTYSAGYPYPVTQNTAGQLCDTGGGGGGGGNVTITSPLGQTTAAASVATTVNPNDVPTTNISGTVTTGGTFQSISTSSTTRHGCFIQNPITATETLFVFFGANASATTSNSVGVAPGAAVTCATGADQVLSDNISVSAATTSHAFMGQVQ